FAIIAFTVFIRLVLVPLTLPSMRAMQKLKDYAPELDKIKKKYAGDKAKLVQAQADFYKDKGINPAAGCLPQLAQFVILIGLFQGFSAVFRAHDITEKLNSVLYPFLQISEDVNKYFLGQDLTAPNVIHIPGLPFAVPGLFLILAAYTQFLSSKLMVPAVKKEEKIAKKTETGSDDAMAMTQKYMVYMFPLMTLVFGFQFSLALVLYWATFSAFQIGQQYLMLPKSSRPPITNFLIGKSS
ncbi:MAG: YidC/Oxa1 family membrane protein insertase, partial [bacterium]|nr:YidC/Oxa1 family membrane protein insertase [bacterium]